MDRPALFPKTPADSGDGMLCSAAARAKVREKSISWCLPKFFSVEG